MSRAPLVLIAGGGTGGHLFPGLAVADVLRDRGVRVAFVGTAGGIEARVVPAQGYDLHLVPGAPLRGGGGARLVRGLRAAVQGTRAARALVRELAPAVVLGVGGYASVAGVLAARLAGVPTVLQEQNALPGLANRLLGRVADHVCLGFAAAASYFPAASAAHTGNPIRAAVLATPAVPHVDRLGLLAFGGSQGARRINEAMVAAVPRLLARGARLDVRHQTGAADLDSTRAAYAAAGAPAAVEAFIDDMGAAYAAAHVVVARAGAMSCAELAARGLPAVLVPYPYAAGDHQRRNAEALVAAGAARMILDRVLDGERLATELAALVDDEPRRLRMAAHAASLGRPDAAARVADACLRLAGGRIA
jgi:UDP-N-acetylglucosamine--N-acetylmuramyl-(pentapeptide) pyrophosphoryl-undecaprenol N-acetylglucosamine transferase